MEYIRNCNKNILWKIRNFCKTYYGIYQKLLYNFLWNILKTSIKTLYKLLKISIYFMEIIRNIYKNLFWKISIRKILSWKILETCIK